MDFSTLLRIEIKYDSTVGCKPFSQIIQEIIPISRTPDRVISVVVSEANHPGGNKIECARAKVRKFFLTRYTKWHAFDLEHSQDVIENWILQVQTEDVRPELPHDKEEISGTTAQIERVPRRIQNPTKSFGVINITSQPFSGVQILGPDRVGPVRIPEPDSLKLPFVKLRQQFLHTHLALPFNELGTSRWIKIGFAQRPKIGGQILQAPLEPVHISDSSIERISVG